MQATHYQIVTGRRYVDNVGPRDKKQLYFPSTITGYSTGKQKRRCRYLFYRKDARDVYVSTTSPEVSAFRWGSSWRLGLITSHSTAEIIL